MSYAELQVTTHFSFLRGASSAEELFSAAALLGIKALGITDRNSLAGMVRAHEASKVTGVRLIGGCRLDLQCGTSLLVYSTDRKSYGRLCRLLTLGKKRAGKGACHIDWPDVEQWNEGLLAILLPDGLGERLPEELRRLRNIFGDRAHCALTRMFQPDEAARLQAHATAAAEANVRTVVTNDVLYHCPSRRMLQDVLTCIRLHTTIDNAGFQKERHADRFLKTPEEMLRLFPKYQDAVRRTLDFIARCKFSLDQLTYTYPTEELEDGLNAQERLEKLTWEGVAQRYSWNKRSQNLLRHANDNATLVRIALDQRFGELFGLLERDVWRQWWYLGIGFHFKQYGPIGGHANPGRRQIHLRPHPPR